MAIAASPLPPPTTTPAPIATIPPIVKWAVAVIIVGGFGELLASKVSPGAGYGFIFIVLFGYALAGDNLTEFRDGLKALGITA